MNKFSRLTRKNEENILFSVKTELSPEKVKFEDPASKKRLGLIALSTDLTTESDYSNILLSDSVSIHTTRVEFENPTTPDNLRLMEPKLTAAAQLLKSIEPLDAVCYSCTAASVVIGDDNVKKAIQSVLPQVPIVTPTSASLKAFRALEIQKISLLTPYLVETTMPLVEFFESNDLDIQKVHCLGLDDDRQMARVSRESIIASALATNSPNSDGFFLSCTGLPAVGVISDIERITGKPVITSNQATAWELLHHSGLKHRPLGYGKIFELKPDVIS